MRSQLLQKNLNDVVPSHGKLMSPEFFFLALILIVTTGCGTEVGNGFNGDWPLPTRQEPKQDDKPLGTEGETETKNDMTNESESPKPAAENVSTIPMGAPGAVKASVFTDEEFYGLAQGCWPIFVIDQDFALTDASSNRTLTGVYASDHKQLTLQVGSIHGASFAKGADNYPNTINSNADQSDLTKETKCKENIETSLDQWNRMDGKFTKYSLNFENTGRAYSMEIIVQNIESKTQMMQVQLKFGEKNLVLDRLPE